MCKYIIKDACTCGYCYLIMTNVGASQEASSLVLFSFWSEECLCSRKSNIGVNQLYYL